MAEQFFHAGSALLALVDGSFIVIFLRGDHAVCQVQTGVQRLGIADFFEHRLGNLRPNFGFAELLDPENRSFRSKQCAFRHHPQVSRSIAAITADTSDCSALCAQTAAHLDFTQQVLGFRRERLIARLHGSWPAFRPHQRLAVFAKALDRPHFRHFLTQRIDALASDRVVRQRNGGAQGFDVGATRYGDSSCVADAAFATPSDRLSQNRRQGTQLRGRSSKQRIPQIEDLLRLLAAQVSRHASVRMADQSEA